MSPRGSVLLRPSRWPGRLPDLVRRARQVREWPALVRRELRGRERVSAYRLRGSGLTFHVRHGTDDLAGIQEVFAQRNYLPPDPAMAILRRRAADGSLSVVDLGGNLGLFALQAFELFPDARVVSFEPDPGNARLLETTIEANAREESWTLVRACAGVAEREVTFLPGRHLESMRVEEPSAQTVTLPELDVFPYLEGCDWLKIDIEGGEWAIFADPRFAQLRIPVIALEYHAHLCPSDEPRELLGDLLTGAGYTVADFEERTPGIGETWAWQEGAERG